MRFGSRAFLAGGLGFAAAFAVACGSSNGLLSSDQSSTLSGQLNSISSAIAAGHCAQAQQAATALNNAVAALPQTVTSTLLQNLGQGAGTVSQLASHDCNPASASSSSSTSSSGTGTSTGATSSVPVTTTTTTTTITPTSSSSTSTSSTAAGGGTATGGGGAGTSTTGSGGAGIGGG